MKLTTTRKSVKTYTIKLDQLNQKKIDWLNMLYAEVQQISADMLNRKRELMLSEQKLKRTGYKRYSNYSVGSAIASQTENYIDTKLNGYLTWKSKRSSTRYPEIKNTPIILRNDCYHVRSSKSAKHFEHWLEFRRHKLPLKISAYHLEQIESANRLLGSQIVKRGKNFFLKLTCEYLVETPTIKRSIGIDMGIVIPLYCSDGHRIGNGRRIVHTKLELAKKRARQQSKSIKISRKQSRWQRDQNHKMSRELVNYCEANGFTNIVLEKLHGHHLSNRKGRKYSWSFAELQRFIDYKAKSAGITVEYVNPKFTSQTCSNCGNKSKRFRSSRSKFECDCGYTTNADFNASRNIMSLSRHDEPNVNPANTEMHVDCESETVTCDQCLILTYEDTTL